MLFPCQYEFKTLDIFFHIKGSPNKQNSRFIWTILYDKLPLQTFLKFTLKTVLYDEQLGLFGARDGADRSDLYAGKGRMGQ